MEKLRTRAFANKKSGVIGSLLLGLLVAGLDSVDRLVPAEMFVPGKPAPISVRLPSTGYLRSSPTAKIKVKFEHESFIIRRGETVPDQAAERYKLLASTLKHREVLLPYRLAGVFLVTFLLCYLLSEAVQRSWPGHRRYLRTEISIYLLIAIIAVLAKPVFVLTSLSPYVVPAAAGPIVISGYRGRRLGVYVTLIVSLVLSVLLDLDAVALVVFLVQGLSVIPFLKPIRRFGPVFAAAGVSTVAGLGAIVGLEMALTGSSEVMRVMEWRDSAILAAIAGGLLAGPTGWIVALMIRPLLGIVSPARLNDLQALQHPLLKRLQTQAPGTWEHSRAIANLAEEAASKIDADALLVRVGSYFHDIGKAVNPPLFVENQEFVEHEGHVNPHDGLAADKSGALIIDHVVQGVQILRNNAVPEAVVEFAYMHHGSSLIEFFWNKYQEECKAKGIEKAELSKADFSYPGIPPQSPETGIMMLADAIEAASRTVTEPTVEKFQRIVDRIVFIKLLEGQLDQSGLTVRDLKVISQSFVESLYFSRHKRVRYQWQDREDGDRKSALPSQIAAAAARAAGDAPSQPSDDEISRPPAMAQPAPQAAVQPASAAASAAASVVASHPVAQPRDPAHALSTANGSAHAHAPTAAPTATPAVAPAPAAAPTPAQTSALAHAPSAVLATTPAPATAQAARHPAYSDAPRRVTQPLPSAGAQPQPQPQHEDAGAATGVGASAGTGAGEDAGKPAGEADAGDGPHRAKVRTLPGVGG